VARLMADAELVGVHSRRSGAVVAPTWPQPLIFSSATSRPPLPMSAGWPTSPSS
jgi:hypothetical protein